MPEHTCVTGSKPTLSLVRCDMSSSTQQGFHERSFLSPALHVIGCDISKTTPMPMAQVSRSGLSSLRESALGTRSQSGLCSDCLTPVVSLSPSRPASSWDSILLGTSPGLCPSFQNPEHCSSVLHCMKCGHIRLSVDVWDLSKRISTK